MFGHGNRTQPMKHYSTAAAVTCAAGSTGIQPNVPSVLTTRIAPIPAQPEPAAKIRETAETNDFPDKLRTAPDAVDCVNLKPERVAFAAVAPTTSNAGPVLLEKERVGDASSPLMLAPVSASILIKFAIFFFHRLSKI